MGCVHFREEYSIDNNYHSARKVHFYFKNAIHSTRAYKRAFELQLGLNCIVCFQRIVIFANGRHTEPTASTELSSSPDLEGVPVPVNRKRAAAAISPEPESVRVKTEMLCENISTDAVDMNDTSDDDDFIQRSSTPGT